MIYRLTIKHGELEFVRYMTEQGLDEYKVIYGDSALIFVEEVPEYSRIPLEEFVQFQMAYYASGANKGQRFGQAFLNYFDKRFPIVEAYRSGPFLWEEKNVERAIHKILYETDCIARNN